MGVESAMMPTSAVSPVVILTVAVAAVRVPATCGTETTERIVGTPTEAYAAAFADATTEVKQVVQSPVVEGHPLMAGFVTLMTGPWEEELEEPPANAYWPTLQT